MSLFSSGSETGIKDIYHPGEPETELSITQLQSLGTPKDGNSLTETRGSRQLKGNPTIMERPNGSRLDSGDTKSSNERLNQASVASSQEHQTRVSGGNPSIYNSQGQQAMSETLSDHLNIDSSTEDDTRIESSLPLNVPEHVKNNTDGTQTEISGRMLPQSPTDANHKKSKTDQAVINRTGKTFHTNTDDHSHQCKHKSKNTTNRMMDHLINQQGNLPLHPTQGTRYAEPPPVREFQHSILDDNTDRYSYQQRHNCYGKQKPPTHRNNPISHTAPANLLAQSPRNAEDQQYKTKEKPTERFSTNTDQHDQQFQQRPLVAEYPGMSQPISPCPILPIDPTPEPLAADSVYHIPQNRSDRNLYQQGGNYYGQHTANHARMAEYNTTHRNNSRSQTLSGMHSQNFDFEYMRTQQQQQRFMQRDNEHSCPPNHFGERQQMQEPETFPQMDTGNHSLPTGNLFPGSEETGEQDPLDTQAGISDYNLPRGNTSPGVDKTRHRANWKQQDPQKDTGKHKFPRGNASSSINDTGHGGGDNGRQPDTPDTQKDTSNHNPHGGNASPPEQRIAHLGGHVNIDNLHHFSAFAIFFLLLYFLKVYFD